jgi:hypothetical protein
LGRHHFVLARDGNAVNFIHQAVLRPFIYLVQAGILACIGKLVTASSLAPGIRDLDADAERWLADEIIRTFFTDGEPPEDSLSLTVSCQATGLESFSPVSTLPEYPVWSEPGHRGLSL